MKFDEFFEDSPSSWIPNIILLSSSFLFLSSLVILILFSSLLFSFLLFSYHLFSSLLISSLLFSSHISFSPPCPWRHQFSPFLNKERNKYAMQSKFLTVILYFQVSFMIPLSLIPVQRFVDLDIWCSFFNLIFDYLYLCSRHHNFLSSDAWQRPKTWSVRLN